MYRGLPPYPHQSCEMDSYVLFSAWNSFFFYLLLKLTKLLNLLTILIIKYNVFNIIIILLIIIYDTNRINVILILFRKSYISLVKYSRIHFRLVKLTRSNLINWLAKYWSRSKADQLKLFKGRLHKNLCHTVSPAELKN